MPTLALRLSDARRIACFKVCSSVLSMSRIFTGGRVVSTAASLWTGLRLKTACVDRVARLGGLEQQSVLSLFRQRFEDQGGRVYEARSVEEAADTLVKILVKEGVKSVVLARMPVEIRKRITERIGKASLSLLEPAGADTARQINSVDAGVSVAGFAVADTGSIAEATYDDVDRLVSALPKIHGCLLRRETIVERFEGTGELVRGSVDASRPSSLTFISGPSRTADVELKLVMGVHGPHQLHVIVFGGE